MTLDRPCSDEECLGDLAVAESLVGELGDPTFAGCERVDPRQHDPAGTRAGGAELGLGLCSQPLGAAAVRAVDRLTEQLSRFGAPVAAPKHDVKRRYDPDNVFHLNHNIAPC